MKERLENLFNIQSGGTPKRNKPLYWLNGTIPWVKIGDIEQHNVITRTEESLTEEGLKSIGNRIFESGTLLLAMYGTIGKTAIAGTSLTCNQAILGINSKDNSLITNSYLRYWFLFKRDELKFKGQGAILKNLSAGFIRKLLIEVPPINIQSQIVKTFERIELLISKRQNTLSLIENIMDSTFLDMFGDPINNPKKITKETLGNLGDWQSGGTPPRKLLQYYHGDISWFSSGELNEIYISDSKEKITSEALKKTSAKKVEKGSLLLGLYDTAALKSSITRIDASCNQAIAFSKLDEKRCDTLYVYYAIKLSKKYYLNQRLGVRQQNLSTKIIKGIEIPLPSIKIQKRFSNRILILLNYKAKLQRSSQILESLMKSFLQKSFVENDQHTANDIRTYINDYLLQQDLLGRIATQDFQVYEEYQQAKNILFKLLESDESEISQIRDFENDRIVLKMN